jgi:hypothetical protein
MGTGECYRDYGGGPGRSTQVRERCDHQVVRHRFHIDRLGGGGGSRRAGAAPGRLHNPPYGRGQGTHAGGRRWAGRARGYDTRVMVNNDIHLRAHPQERSPITIRIRHTKGLFVESDESGSHVTVYGYVCVTVTREAP